MARYTLRFAPAANRDLQQLAPSERERLVDALSDVAGHEQPSSHPDVRALTGDRQGRLRLRVGDWRAILELDKPALLVHAVGDRETIYNE